MATVYPAPFLEIRSQHVDIPLTEGLCAGYDGGKWRSKQLAAHLFEWLPFAALKQEHQLIFGANNFYQMLHEAAAHVYDTNKTASRGELGELLLHLACILYCKTQPVMCKLILKTSSNDTVKGFDGIHVLVKGQTFELWLGEAKFYTDGEHAIRDAISSIKSHILPNFLNTEKSMLLGHVGPDVPFSKEIKQLFHVQTSGDNLLKIAVFPILITYESQAVATFTSLSDAYVAELKKEVMSLRSYFVSKAADLKLRFHLIFVPLGKKEDVVNSFDKFLEPFL